MESINDPGSVDSIMSNLHNQFNKIKEEAIRRCHSGMAGGHMGLRKTMDQVQRRFYWLSWQGDVARFCRRCTACCSNHRGRLPRKALLQPTEASAPFEDCLLILLVLIVNLIEATPGFLLVSIHKLNGPKLSRFEIRKPAQ